MRRGEKELAVERWREGAEAKMGRERGRERGEREARVPGCQRTSAQVLVQHATCDQV